MQIIAQYTWIFQAMLLIRQNISWYHNLKEYVLAEKNLITLSEIN